MSELHSPWRDEQAAAVADRDDARRHEQDIGPKRVPVPSIERARQLCRSAIEEVEIAQQELGSFSDIQGANYTAGFISRCVIEERKLKVIAAAIGDGSVRTTTEALGNVRLQVVGMKEAAKTLPDGPVLIRAFDRVLGIILNEFIEAGECR